VEEGVRRVAPLPLLFVKLLVNAPLGASAAPLDNDGLPCGAHDVPVGARAPPPTSRSAPAPPLTASQPSSPRFLRKHPRLEGCNTGLRFSRKHPRGCISIQPQIIPPQAWVRPAQGQRNGVLRGLIQDPASELRRIFLPRTPVNKDETFQCFGCRQ
jgi:hypothetical protein